MALEGELVLGQLRHRGAVLEELGVDGGEDAAHPLVELGVGELGRQELQRRVGAVGLQLGNRPLLPHHPHPVAGQTHLLVADLEVLFRQRQLEPPVLLPSLVARDRLEEGRGGDQRAADIADAPHTEGRRLLDRRRHVEVDHTRRLETEGGFLQLREVLVDEARVVVDRDPHPIPLQLGEPHAGLCLGGPKILEAHAGVGEARILSGFEHRVRLGVPLLQRGQHGPLHLTRELSQLLGTLDEHGVAIERRPDRHGAGERQLASRADRREPTHSVGRRRVRLEVPLQPGDVPAVPELVEVELGPEPERPEERIGRHAELESGGRHVLPPGRPAGGIDRGRPRGIRRSNGARHGEHGGVRRERGLGARDGVAAVADDAGERGRRQRVAAGRLGRGEESLPLGVPGEILGQHRGRVLDGHREARGVVDGPEAPADLGAQAVVADAHQQPADQLLAGPQRLPELGRVQQLERGQIEYASPRNRLGGVLCELGVGVVQEAADHREQP